jgi:hypothetical protein
MDMIHVEVCSDQIHDWLRESALLIHEAFVMGIGLPVFQKVSKDHNKLEHLSALVHTNEETVDVTVVLPEAQQARISSGMLLT